MEQLVCGLTMMRLYYEGVQLLGMVRKELGNDYEVRYGLDWIYPSDE